MSSCLFLQSKLKLLKQSLRELELMMEDVATEKVVADFRIIYQTWTIQFNQFQQEKKKLTESTLVAYLKINRELILKEDSESLKEKLRDLILKTEEDFYKSILVELTKGLNWEQLLSIKPIYLELLPKHLISKTRTEALSGKYFIHDGDLDFRDLDNFKPTKFVDILFGSLDLRSLVKIENITFPQMIHGYLNLNSLSSAEGLTLPQTVGGDLELRCLQTIKGLKLPELVDGVIRFNCISRFDFEELVKSYPNLFLSPP